MSRRKQRKEMDHRVLELWEKGVPYKEIAEQLGEPTNRVRGSLRRMGKVGQSSWTEEHDRYVLNNPGLSAREYARRLHLDASTVRAHLESRDMVYLYRYMMHQFPAPLGWDPNWRCPA